MTDKLLFILVLITVFLTHSTYLANGFTWLDHGDIVLGRTILPIARLQQAFLTRLGETSFYRPTVTIVNSLDHYLYRGNPWGYHLTNLMLFLLVCYATYIFAQLFFGLKRKESMFVVLIAGVHPLSILPVGAVSYRQELMAVAFTYFAVYAYIKSHKVKLFIWRVAVFIFGLLALFSKESAIFWLWAFILIWEVMEGYPVNKIIGTAKPSLFFAIVFYLLLRIRAVPEFWQSKKYDLSIGQAVGTRLAVFLQRLIELLDPFKPKLSDATQVKNMGSWEAWVAVFIILICLAVILKSKKNPILQKIILFTLVALLPALSFFPLPRFSSSHYSFVAAPAAGVLVVLFWRELSAYLSNILKTGFIVAVAIWIITMSINTYKAGYQFKDDLTLFSPEVIKDDYFREGHYYLGDYYLRQGNLNLAESHLESSLNKADDIIAFVDESAAKINLAGVYLNTNKTDKAKKILKEVLKEKSVGNRLRALYNLAVISEREKDYQGVVKLLEEEVNYFSQPEPILLYVKGLVKEGREKEADIILKNKLLLTDRQKRQEIIQTFLSDN